MKHRLLLLTLLVSSFTFANSGFDNNGKDLLNNNLLGGGSERPHSLTATALYDSEKEGIQLKWQHTNTGSGSIFWQIVYRKHGTLSFDTLIHIHSGTTNEFVDTTAKPGIKYTYFVRGFASYTGYDDSNTASAELEIKHPHSLTTEVKQDSTHGVQLKWLLDSNKVQPVFQFVFRKHDTSSFDTLASVSNHAQAYFDSTAQPGIRYTYFVRTSTGPVGYDYHDSDTASAKLNDPDRAYNLTATAIQDSVQGIQGIQLRWLQTSNGSLPKFQFLFRKHDTLSFDTLVKVNNSARAYLDTTAELGVKYTYFVRTSSGPAGYDYDDSDTASASLKDVDPVGIEEFSISSFTIYPNPVGDLLVVEGLNGSRSIQNMQIFDVLGKEQFSEIIRSSNRVTINVDDLPSGNYFLRIEGASYQFIKK